MQNTVINIVLFQLGWFACVLGAAHDYLFIGSLVAIAIIVLHIVTSITWRQEMVMIVVAMLVGFSWDSLLVFLKLLEYPNGQLLPHTAPYWIVIMWGLFTITFNLSLNWLKNRILLSIIFGALGGPLAYYAGARLGAVQIIETNQAILALSVGWGILTPLLLQFSKYLNSSRFRLLRSPS